MNSDKDFDIRYTVFLRSLDRVVRAAKKFADESGRVGQLHEARISKVQEQLLQACQEVVKAWDDRTIPLSDLERSMFAKIGEEKGKEV
jgi:hypothetical protein